MTNKQHNTQRLVTNNLLTISFSFMALSCVDHDIQRAVPMKGDYFPMTEGSRWEYVTKYSCPEDGTTVCYDTVEYFAEGNDFYWNGHYLPLSAVYGTFMWIKRVNDEYYALGAYISEYKFLDASLPLKASWGYHDWTIKEFTIIEVNGTKTVNGIIYENVIGVLQTESWVNDDGEFHETLRAYHYYAKDVGEIYTYYPDSPARSSGEMEVFLISHIISQ